MRKLNIGETEKLLIEQKLNPSVKVIPTIDNIGWGWLPEENYSSEYISRDFNHCGYTLYLHPVYAGITNTVNWLSGDSRNSYNAITPGWFFNRVIKFYSETQDSKSRTKSFTVKFRKGWLVLDSTDNGGHVHPQYAVPAPAVNNMSNVMQAIKREYGSDAEFLKAVLIEAYSPINQVHGAPKPKWRKKGRQYDVPSFERIDECLRNVQNFYDTIGDDIMLWIRQDDTGWGVQVLDIKNQRYNIVSDFYALDTEDIIDGLKERQSEIYIPF